MTRPRVAFRCDGGDAIGAGHVARCLPLARALAERGWDPAFAGHYDGLAGDLLKRSGLATVSPTTGRSSRAGLDPAAWRAAVVDLYGVPADELCQLADRLPIATIGESSRCERAGVLLDYHLDLTEALSDDRRLLGPRYAPVDPAFAAARRPREPVRRILVTVGGSDVGRLLVPTLVAQARRAFPGARVVVAGAGGLELGDVEHLPAPGALVDVVASIDVAFSAAGLTAYEIACAGVPSLIVAIAENQRRVLDGCVAAGVAIGVDAIGGVDAATLAEAVDRLALATERERLALAGPACIDGEGAARAAAALERLWGRAPSVHAVEH